MSNQSQATKGSGGNAARLLGAALTLKAWGGGWPPVCPWTAGTQRAHPFPQDSPGIPARAQAQDGRDAAGIPQLVAQSQVDPQAS